MFSRPNFALLVYLFAPVLFLPFLSPRYLLPVVPLQVLYLAGDVTMATRYGPQSVAIISFIFLATPRGLNRFGRKSVEKVSIDRRVLITMAAAAVSFFVLYAPSSIYEQPWNWGGQDAADGARIEAAEPLPRDAAGAGVGVDAGAVGRAGAAVPPRARASRRACTRRRGRDPRRRRHRHRSCARSPRSNAYRERILELQIAQHGFTVQSDAEDIVVFVRPPDQS